MQVGLLRVGLLLGLPECLADCRDGRRGEVELVLARCLPAGVVRATGQVQADGTCDDADDRQTAAQPRGRIAV